MCDSGTWRVAWRYITASDRPTIWLVVNKDQSIYTVWEAEDQSVIIILKSQPFEGETLQPGQYPLSVEPLVCSSGISLINYPKLIHSQS